MKKNIYLAIIILQAITITFSSCVNQKQIAYFQKSQGQSDTIKIAKAYVPKIQSGDILSINIGSLNAIASSFFNPYSSMTANIETSDATSAGSGVAPTPALSQSASPGYLVGADGIIEIPLVGSVKLAGLTTTQAKELIKDRLKKYLKEPTVNVRVMNYKISVMGEVAKPGVFIIPNETITIPEALSMAGDLTIYGKRNNVLVVRDLDGEKEFGRINLNSRDIYTSPYFYLHNNDVIYVEPGNARSTQANQAVTLVPIAVSILTLILIIVRK